MKKEPKPPHPLKLVKDKIYINAAYRKKSLSEFVFFCEGTAEKLERLVLQFEEGKYPDMNAGIHANLYADWKYHLDQK